MRPVRAPHFNMMNVRCLRRILDNVKRRTFQMSMELTDREKWYEVEHQACMMSTERKNNSKADYRREKTLEVFDHQIHQKLAMDVIGVSFNAHEIFGNGHGYSSGT